MANFWCEGCLKTSGASKINIPIAAMSSFNVKGRPCSFNLSPFRLLPILHARENRPDNVGSWAGRLYSVMPSTLRALTSNRPNAPVKSTIEAALHP